MSENPKENSENGLSNSDRAEFWRYFSGRADQSADALRAILFASANAGIIFSWEKPSGNNDGACEKISQISSLTSISGQIALNLCLLFLVISWNNQKQKSIDRRKNVKVYHKIEEFENEIGKGMHNSDLDWIGTYLLLIGYLLIAVSTVTI